MTARQPRASLDACRYCGAGCARLVQAYEPCQHAEHYVAVPRMLCPLCACEYQRAPWGFPLCPSAPEDA